MQPGSTQVHCVMTQCAWGLGHAEGVARCLAAALASRGCGEGTATLTVESSDRDKAMCLGTGTLRCRFWSTRLSSTKMLHQVVGARQPPSLVLSDHQQNLDAVKTSLMPAAVQEVGKAAADISEVCL